MFIRRYTQHTLEGTEAGSTLWKVIHAVLNASADGCLTTKDVENAIRWHYPLQHFTQANVSHSLSHSRDFKQVGHGGRGRRRWTLTGKSDGVKGRRVMAVSRSPTMFVRRYTHFTLPYVALESGRVATWKACHVVLNASAEGCLTTKQVEEALRSVYPGRTIKRSTLSYNLSESQDFKQVYLEGKAPGRWFLTGEVKGITRTNAIREMDPYWASGRSDDDDDGSGAVTLRDTPPASDFPYPSKTEEIEAQYSPEPTFSSPTLSLSPSTVTSTKITLSTLLPPSRAFNYSLVTSGCLPEYQSCPESYEYYFANQLNTVPAQDTASSACPNNYMNEESFSALDTLPGSLGPSPPPYSLSNDHLLSNTPPAPTLTPGDVFIWTQNGVEPHLPTASYPRDLRSNAAETPNHIGSFGEGNTSTSFPGDDSVREHWSGEFFGGGIAETNASKPVYSRTVIYQQGVLDAHYPLACPPYTSYNCGGSLGAWISLAQTPTNSAVTMSGPPIGDSFPYLLS